MKHTRKNKTKKPYRDSRRFDASCRNQGRCPWCADCRKFRERRQSTSAGPAEMPLPEEKIISGHILLEQDSA